MADARFLEGDSLAVLGTLGPASIDAAVTSPPYWGKVDYGFAGQLGLEDDPDAYVARLADVLDEVARVLVPGGAAWLVLSDTYFGDTPPRRAWSEASSVVWDPRVTRSRGGVRRSAAARGPLRKKCLVGIPWRVAAECVRRGWIVRAEVTWAKPNARPEPARDRPGRSHETLFLLARRRHYHYDPTALPPWARGSVWALPSEPGVGGHPATFPLALADACVRSVTPPGGVALDPFMGSGTTGLAALASGRDFVGIDAKPEYVRLARARCAGSRRQAD